jgi:hypothetical protein
MDQAIARAMMLARKILNAGDVRMVASLSEALARQRTSFPNRPCAAV